MGEATYSCSERAALPRAGLVASMMSQTGYSFARSDCRRLWGQTRWRPIPSIVTNSGASQNITI